MAEADAVSAGLGGDRLAHTVHEVGVPRRTHRIRLRKHCRDLEKPVSGENVALSLRNTVLVQRRTCMPRLRVQTKLSVS